MIKCPHCGSDNITVDPEPTNDYDGEYNDNETVYYAGCEDCDITGIIIKSNEKSRFEQI